MRSDYALYIVAVIFFLLTAIAAVMLLDPERPLWVVTTIILGLLFIGLGYSQRPKLRAAAIGTPPPPPPAPPASPTPSVSSTVTEVVAETEATKETVTEAVQPTRIELTEVKGIGEKRAQQLKALSINSVEDLAKASVQDLATKLRISPKITVKWIDHAKKLVEKS